MLCFREKLADKIPPRQVLYVVYAYHSSVPQSEIYQVKFTLIDGIFGSLLEGTRRMPARASCMTLIAHYTEHVLLGRILAGLALSAESHSRLGIA